MRNLRELLVELQATAANEIYVFPTPKSPGNSKPSYTAENRGFHREGHAKIAITVEKEEYDDLVAAGATVLDKSTEKP